jgi:hypothetical protein
MKTDKIPVTDHLSDKTRYSKNMKVYKRILETPSMEIHTFAIYLNQNRTHSILSSLFGQQ